MCKNVTDSSKRCKCFGFARFAAGTAFKIYYIFSAYSRFQVFFVLFFLAILVLVLIFYFFFVSGVGGVANRKLAEGKRSYCTLGFNLRRCYVEILVGCGAAAVVG